MTAVAEKADTYLQDFVQSQKTLIGHQFPWLVQKRNEGIARFSELGFPTTKQEAWRFTSVEPIARTRFQPTDVKPVGLDANQVKTYSYGPLEGFQLVFVNGWYMPEFSTVPQAVPGLKVHTLAELLPTHGADLERHLGRYAVEDQHPFTSLNTAFFADGAHIYLSKGTIIQAPIHLLFISLPNGQPVQSHPRVLIVAEQDTQASIVETYAGNAGAVYLTNAVSEVVLGENAQITHYKVEQESQAAYHVATLQVQQARNSRFTSHAMLLGGAIVRNNINIALAAEGAECTLNGLYMMSGTQHIDTHSFIDHVKPHGTSHEFYKGVLDGKAHAVFDGQITVRPDAQKTDSTQTNKNLLLSDQAKIDTKPELQIFANDVKCKHGATIGQISSEALFYLRSRGVALPDARKLLISAFASEMINKVEIEPLREALLKLCQI